MDEKNSDIDYKIADIITGMPHEFTVGRKTVRLYPVTLAKTYILARVMSGLAINREILSFNPNLEILRLVEEKKELCCRLLSIHATPNTYKDLFNSRSIAERRNLFMKMSNEDVAVLMLYVLTSDATEEVIKHLGLDKERERLAKVMKVKKDDSKNNVSFGGLTIFGSFIGQLKEMGYSDNEILYERGYSFLRLMLADKITSVYLSDDELNKLPADVGGTMFDGNDPASFEKLKARMSAKGVKMIN